MTTQTTNMSAFYEQMRINASAKAKQMATLELSCWDEKHESELKEFYGFTDKKLKARKAQLQKEAA